MTQAKLQQRVEELVDGSTLDAVLAALEEVCHGKAEHLAVNWQDTTAAREWTRAARLLDKVRARVEV